MRYPLTTLKDLLMRTQRIGALAIAALVSTTVIAPQATAAPDGSAAVISEVSVSYTHLTLPTSDLV